MDIATLGLAVDSRPVGQAEKALNNLADAGARAESTLGRAATNLTGALERTGAAAKAEAAALVATGRATRDSAQAHDAHATAYRNQQTAADKYLSTLRQEAAEYGKTRAQVEALRAAQMGLTAEQQRHAAALGAHIDMMRGAQGQMSGLAGAAGAMGAAVAAGFAVERIYTFTRALFDASAAGERIRTTLDFASGGNATRELQYVTQLTNALGLELTSTAKAYASFQAASRGTTLEGDAARRVFESVTKAAAVMGLTTDQTTGALLALQQMVSKGTVSAEELRGQLSERLPGAFQIAARAMGVTTGELGKMLEQGLIPASDFLPKFAAQLSSELGDASEKASQRLDASVNRIANAWERLKRAAGDSGIAEGFAAAAEGGAASLNGIAAAMEIARENGAGFAGQAWAAAKAAYALGNETDRAKVNMIDNAKATKEAEAELKRLQERGDNTSPNIYIRNSYYQLQEYVKELRAAKAAQDALQGLGAGAAGGGRGTVNPQTVAQRNAEKEARDAELKGYLEKDIRQTREQKITEEIAKARAANAALMAKHADDEAAKTKLRAALETEIANIREKNKPKGAGAGAAARDEVNAEIAEFQRGQSVREEISRRTIAALSAQRAAGAMDEIEYVRAVADEEARRNADAQAALELQIEAAQRKANNQTQVTTLEGQLALLQEKALTREQQLQTDIAEIERKRAESKRNLHNGEITRSTQELAAMVAQNKQAALELETIGLTDKELQALNETRMVSTEERQREKIAAMEMLDVSGENADAIELERQKLEELIKARQLYSSRANRQRAVDQEQRMYSSMWESLDRTAHDVFVNVADNGMDAFERIGKTLKASVLDMLYQMTVRKWLVNIGANVFGSGFANAANAATGGGALSGGVGLLGSLGNNALGSAAMGFIGNTGAFGAGAASAVGEAALGSAFVGPSASAAGGMVGAGATFGQFIPYIGIGLALLSMLGDTGGETRTGGQFGIAYNGQVRNNRRDQVYTYQGQQFDRDFSGGRRDAFVDGQAYRMEGDPVAQEAAIRGAVAGTGAGINAMLSALGSSARVTNFSAGLETSEKGRGGVFAGGQLSTGALFGESGKGDNYAGTLYETTSTQSPDFQTALANFTLDLKQSTLQALKAADDIPKSVKDALANVDIEGLTDAQADALLTFISAQIEGVKNLKEAFGDLGMPRLAAMSYDTAVAMAEVAGGFDKLQESMAGYLANYYSDAERNAMQTEDLRGRFAELGFEMPKTRAEFRALVEANEALGEAGAKNVAALLDLQDEFAAVTPEINNATDALKRQRDSAWAALQKAIAAERRMLQERMNVAQEIENRLSGIFDVLHNNVRELYGEMDDTARMQTVQGNDFIARAISVARASGMLPDADKLAEAIEAARAGLTVDNYGGDQAERDYAALVLAGKLSALETVAGKQLTDAQKTVRELELQSKQLDETLEYWQQQIDIANGTYNATLSVEQAVRDLGTALGVTTPGGTIGGPGTGGGGSGGPTGGPSQGRVGYGADEALTSFEKFKAWYTGLRNTADPNLFKDGGYKVPDWMRVSGLAADGSDEELFDQYQFFLNNPGYAQDYERVFTTGRSGFATDGSTLAKSNLSKMPAEVADYFRKNPDALLAYEGMGMDPVLAYQLYTGGAEQFGLDADNTNFTNWLQNNKWTANGIIANDNVAEFSATPYANYRQNKYDSQTGNIVGMDGNLYTLDGKLVGRASQGQLDSAYGPGFKPLKNGRSSLYDSHVGEGDPTSYYQAIRANLDAAISEGKSAQWLADAIGSSGASIEDVAKAYGTTPQQIRENLIANGATRLPAYRVGTNYVPEDGPAYLHEGEAVVPKEFNPAAHGMDFVGSGWGQAVALLGRIRDFAEGSEANTLRIVELLTSVIDGNTLVTSPAPDASVGV